MEEEINIIITMAGMSQRFFDAGYSVPKYMLDVNGNSAFELSIKTFRNYFSTNKFVFIIRDIFDTENFIKNSCNKNGIKNYEVITLNYNTKGQAETVFHGINLARINENTPVVIFNIDTFRKNFVFPKSISSYDGYLEVFNGSGSNWSYVRPLNSESTLVIETAEKNEISNLCSTGLYYFASVKLFNLAFTLFINNDFKLKEIYIAPIFNYLISNNYKIHYHLIENDDVVFCGTPDEYERLVK